MKAHAVRAARASPFASESGIDSQHDSSPKKIGGMFSCLLLLSTYLIRLTLSDTSMFLSLISPSNDVISYLKISLHIGRVLSAHLQMHCHYSEVSIIHFRLVRKVLA